MRGWRLVRAALAAALRRPRWTGVAGVGLLAAIVLAALLSPLAGYPVGADVDPGARALGPSWAHPLGTDHLGRDIFWRWLLAARAFVGPGLLACLLTGVGGVSLGATAGWLGGAAEAAIRFLLGSVASIPRLVLVLLICTIYGAGLPQLAVAAGLAGIPAVAAVVLARIEQLRSAEFVRASIAHGVPSSRLLFAHLVGAACGRGVARQLFATFGSFVVLECTLSYLGGLGVPEPTPSWGNMLVFDWGRGTSLAMVVPALSIWATVAASVAAGRLFVSRPAPARPAAGRPSTTPAAAPSSSRPGASAPASGRPLVLDGLTVKAGERTLVDEVTLSIWPGQLTGLVGASGSGKTLTCRALLGLVDLDPGVVQADLRIPGADGTVRTPYAHALGASRSGRDRAFRGLRGACVGYLPQHAQAALDPLLRVGRQIRAADPVHWLVEAGFPAEDAPRVAELFPHELSGGMAQRVAIAQVLALGSPFLVADEPTTGLDAAVQRRFVEQLRRLADRGLGVLMVTHDLRLLADTADRVLLMDGGRIVESWSTEQLADGEPDTDAGRRLLTAARRQAW